MEKYDFKLTPAYCLWNGVAIQKQYGCTIRFVLTNPKNTHFCERLKTSFIKHITYVISQKDSPEYFRRIPSVEFVQGTKKEIRDIIQKQYLLDEHYYKRNEETPHGSLLFDEIIEEAVNKQISEIHIFNSKVYFRENGRFREFFALTETEMYHLGETIKSFLNPNQQNGFFMYGSEKTVFLEASNLQTINRNKGNKTQSFTLRLINIKTLPSKTETFGFTESQVDIITSFSELSPKLISITDISKEFRNEILSSILFEIEKRNEKKLKIISIEKSPLYFCPGIIYTDTAAIKQKDDFEMYQNVFRQLPDLIVVGDVFDKKTFFFCVAALKRGINVIAGFPSKNLDSLITDLQLLGIPKNELFSFNNCFITKENNFQQENPKFLIDIAVFSPDKRTSTKKSDFNKQMLHYTNYHQILTENLQFIFSRKQKPYSIKSPYPLFHFKNPNPQEKEDTIKIMGEVNEA